VHAPAAGRVLVGVDQSPAGLQALRYAIAQARTRRSHLVAVRSWRLRLPNDGWYVARCRQETPDEARMSLDAAFIAAVGKVPRDLSICFSVPEGAPGPALVTAACRQTDLLVVGGSARSGGWLPARTSVAWYCARHAPCPVVVVPAPDLARTSTRRLLRAIRRDAQRGVDGPLGTSRAK